MTFPYYPSHSFVYHSSLCDSILYDCRVPFCAADLARPVLAFFAEGGFWHYRCAARGTLFV